MTRLRDGFLGSIAAKLALAGLALGGAVAAAVLVGTLVFSSVSASVSTLMDQALPRIETSSQVIAVTGRLRDSLSALGNSSTPAETRAIAADIDSKLSELSVAKSALSPDEASNIEQMIQATREATERMAAALQDRFDAETDMVAQIDNLQIVTEDVRAKLTTLADDAIFNLSIRSEETVSAVRDTLTGLTEREFAEMRTVLDIRAEVNLLASVALAQAETLILHSIKS